MTRRATLYVYDDTNGVPRMDETERYKAIQVHPDRLDAVLAATKPDEEPVPPLPTTPYTVIRATVRDEKPDVFVLRDDLTGYETVWAGTSWVLDPQIAAERITSFVVLSEPRPVTAKAVLDRVLEEETGGYWSAGLTTVAREFGVE